MTIKVSHEQQATRSFELEVEVPGSPEQVWQAIATGPGISSWFVASEVDGREGGKVAFHLWHGMVSEGVVTAWEPPRRFAYLEKDWNPGAPPIATEFQVEARAGGTCVVRLVTSLFTSAEDWDDQLDSMESGWPTLLMFLRLSLTHFAGEPCARVHVTGTGAGPWERTWSALAGGLGLADRVEPGRRIAAASGAPALAGSVERDHAGDGHHSLALRTDEPGPGLALIGAYRMGEEVLTIVTLYLFGEQASAVAAREQPAWQRWIEAHFPPRAPEAPGD
jgi:uncharacterized protein YndB with AHSA1/START domain